MIRRFNILIPFVISLLSYGVVPVFSQEVAAVDKTVTIDKDVNFDGAVTSDEAAALYKQNNFPAAFKAFSKLAAEGDARSQTILALMYKFGEGTQIDTQKAFSLYRQAAEQGYAPAQFHTGKHYAEGLDTNPNLIKAEFWLKEAAKQGFSRAESSLVEVLESQKYLRAELRQDYQVQKNISSGSNNPKRTNNSKRTRTKDWDLRLPRVYSIEKQPQLPIVSSNNSSRNSLSNRSLSENSLSEKKKSLDKEKKYRAQIGAMTSEGAANNLWVALNEANPQLFAGFEPQVSSTNEINGIIYRLRTGQFSTYREAQDFCDKLLQKEGHAGCLAIKAR